MNVLEVFGEPIASGGQESFVFNVLQNIDRTDLQIDFFTPYSCSNPYYEALIREYAGRLFCGNLSFRPGASRRNIILPLKKVLENEEYDAVHVHSGSISVLAYSSYTAHHCGVPNIIVHSHSTVIRDNLKYRLTKAYGAFFFHRYPTQFCACSKEAGACKFPNDITAGRLQIVRNGIDLSCFAYNPLLRSEYRKKLGISENTLLIGHVGRFAQQKNHRFDLDILEELKKRTETDIRLLWIGEGELEEELRRMVTERNLQKEVIFGGVVMNVQDYLQAMDMFILPSLFEGLGIVGVEAQAAGLPVLVSDRVPQELALTDSVSFLSLNNPGLWADAILNTGKTRALENPEKLLAAGYDIRQTAAVVRKLYFPDPRDKA